jgi:type VI secretion system protein ImpC
MTREPARAASALNALIRAATGGPCTSPDVDHSAVETLLVELEDLIQSQLDAIFENESLMALERAWRNLKLLVDRFDARKGATLEVLACQVEDLPEATYEQVLMPEHNRTDGPALSMIVCGAMFGRSTADVERMRDLAETGLSLQTPVLASVDHHFFGIDTITDLRDLPILWQHLDGPAYTEWSKLRSEDAAAFLTLCLPPFVLRAEQRGQQHMIKRPLYGPGAVMLAAAIGESFARTGWPTHLRDEKSEPVRECEIAITQNRLLPLSTLIPSRKQSELSDAGFAVLDALEKEDAICVCRAPTVKEPRTYQTTEANAEARAHAALACRLFVSRAAHFMLDLQDNLPEDLRPEDAPLWLTNQITSFLRQGDVDVVPDECISIEPVDGSQIPGMTVFAVRIVPPDTIVDLGHDISLVMGCKIPGSVA